MKIRNGFVSNSSSSSFICEVSGEVESGMDMSIREAEMYGCEKGHVFCERYLIDDKNEISSFEEDDEEDELPSRMCPLCQFKHLSDNDMIAYLLKKLNLTKEKILQEVKTKFKTYDEFVEFYKVE